MRSRSVAVLCVLGLGLAAMTRAQQPAAAPPPAAPDPAQQQAERAKLRASVVRLNTEVELLQLEHEAEWAVLLEALKDVRQSEMIAEMGSPYVRKLGAWASAGILKGEAAEAVGAATAKGLDAGAAGQQYAKGVERRRIDATRQYVERKKKELARHAAELTEKRLEYSEAEKKYNGS